MGPIRTAFLLPHFRAGGLEKVVLNLLSSFDRKRVQGELILLKREGEFLKELPGDVPIHDLGGQRALFSPFALKKLLDRLQIDVLYTGTNATNLLALSSRVLGHKRTVLTISEHTPLNAGLLDYKWRFLRQLAMRFLYTRADALVVPVDMIGAECRALIGSECPPVTMLNNPVLDAETPKLPVADSDPLQFSNHDGPHFVSIGRLAPEKRFHLLIEAFYQMFQKRPDARLTIIGDGPDRAKLEALIEERGLSDVVILAGFLSLPRARIGGADVFVCSSSREAAPGAMLEAMAESVAIVSFDCPFGPPYLLQDGLSGVLVENGNVTALAEAMGAILDDEEARRTYIERSVAFVKRYEKHAATRVYEDFFIEQARQS